MPAKLYLDVRTSRLDWDDRATSLLDGTVCKRRVERGEWIGVLRPGEMNGIRNIQPLFVPLKRLCNLRRMPDLDVG